MTLAGLQAVTIPPSDATTPPEVSIEIVSEQHWGTAWTDPELDNTEISLSDYGPAGSFEATWTLEESTGETVVGPVAAGSSESGLLMFDLDLAHLGAAGLEGAYVVRFTNTVQTPDGPASASVSRPITLALEPPPQPVRGAAVLDGVIRMAKAGHERVGDEQASFTAPVLSRGSTKATLVIRDQDGLIVARSGQSDGSDESTYVWTWDGQRTLGGGLPAGVYTASAVIPDYYGRSRTVRLGFVRVFHMTPDKAVRRTYAQVSARLGAPRHAVSRTFNVRLPDHDGPVDVLSPLVRAAHVSDRPGHFRIDVRIPSVSRRWTEEHRTRSRSHADSARASWFEGSPWELPAWFAGESVGGLRVEVRVTVRDGSAITISGVGAAVQNWHWAL